MILTFSDSEEEILNKIKSVLVCENTVEFMDNVNIQKLRFPSLEIDQLQRCVIREDKTVGLTRHEYDLLLYLALSPNRFISPVSQEESTRKNRSISISMRKRSQK